MIITVANEVCDYCNRSIKDPICMNCYNKELLEWLRENIGNSEVIIYIMRRIAKKFKTENLGYDYCIICGKENVFICSYCYVSSFMRILQEINIPNRTLKNFEVIFDLDHLIKN